MFFEEGRNGWTILDAKVDSSTIVPIPGEGTNVNTHFFSGVLIAESASRAARHAGLGGVFSELVHRALDAGSADFGLVVGVVEHWSRMALGHAHSKSIVGLRLHKGIQVGTDEDAGPGLVVAPESIGVSGGVADVVGRAAGEDALPEADVSIVGDGLAGDGVEGAEGDAPFGGWVSPGGLDCAAAVAEVVGVVGEGVVGAVEGVVVAPPVLAVSAALALGHALPGTVVLCEVTRWTIVNASPISGLVSKESHSTHRHA